MRYGRVGSVAALVAMLAGCNTGGTGNGNDNTSADPCDDVGVICTVAGTGRSAFDGDGKPALESAFYYPFDVVFDEQGRPLILDWNNFRVRRLNEDGTLETVVGVGFEAAPEDGALATETPLHHASDLEFDVDGSLLISGDHAPVVFEMRTDDRVWIIAGDVDLYGYDGDGGPALNAALSAPFGVLPDGTGGFYCSDVDAHVVRHVDAAGIISTTAGTGEPGYSGDGGPGTEAQLRGPTRMRRDSAGNLYICDTDNHVIRLVDPDGVITTFAGTGELGFSGDGGPASEAQLNAPYAMDFAPNGDLYVADTGNNCIRRIDTEGVITTVAGTGEAGFAGDLGLAGHSQLNRPSGVNFDADGNMWICDTFNQRVRVVSRFLETIGE